MVTLVCWPVSSQEISTVSVETEVIKLLDSKGIRYRLLPHAKPAFTCEAAAEERNVPLNEVIKCILLVDRKKKCYLACITADKMLDTTKVRNILNSTRLSFASEHEIEEVSGYKMGSIPPLLSKTDVAVIFDEDIVEKEKVNISSGDPKLGLELSPDDLVDLIEPRSGCITK